MDEIMKQQKELEVAFDGLKKCFDEAKLTFRQRHESMLKLIRDSQKQEASHLAQIHSALQNIMRNSDEGK